MKTIRSLTKSYEKEQNCFGLAQVWDEWYICNYNRESIMQDFRSLSKNERQEMLHFLMMERESFGDVLDYILQNLYR